MERWAELALDREAGRGLRALFHEVAETFSRRSPAYCMERAHFLQGNAAPFPDWNFVTLQRI
jgi:hypothetical protein